MGQYYIAVNLSKGEYLDPLDFNNGLKLMEHSYVGNNFMNAVGKLLMPGEHWYGDKIAWIGDYIEPFDELMDEPIINSANVVQLSEKVNKDNTEDEQYDINLYDYADEYFVNAAEYVPNNKIAPKYFVNTDTAEYVCTDDAIKYWNGDRAHPLSILTCYDSNSGGSYYPVKKYHDKEYVSMWKGCPIEAYATKKDMVEECSDGLTHLIPEFFEMDPDNEQNKCVFDNMPWLKDFLNLKSEQPDTAPNEILNNVFKEYHFCKQNNELEL